MNDKYFPLELGGTSLYPMMALYGNFLGHRSGIFEGPSPNASPELGSVGARDPARPWRAGGGVRLLLVVKDLSPYYGRGEISEIAFRDFDSISPPRHPRISKFLILPPAGLPSRRKNSNPRKVIVIMVAKGIPILCTHWHRHHDDQCHEATHVLNADQSRQATRLHHHPS